MQNIDPDIDIGMVNCIRCDIITYSFEKPAGILPCSHPDIQNFPLNERFLVSYEFNYLNPIEGLILTLKDLPARMGKDWPRQPKNENGSAMGAYNGGATEKTGVREAILLYASGSKEKSSLLGVSPSVPGTKSVPARNPVTVIR